MKIIIEDSGNNLSLILLYALTLCIKLRFVDIPGTEWKTYKPGGIHMKVYPINLDTEEIDEPRMVRVDVDETVGELKQEIASLFDMDPISLQVN